MEDETTPTSDTSTALAPAGESTPDITGAGAASSGSESGAVQQVAQQAADQAAGAVDPVEQALTAIPADDNDLSTYQGQPHYQTLTSQRNQLRVLSGALRELQPLKAFQQYGDPTVVQSRLKIAELLYQPAKDRNGRPIRDPNTQATRIDTRAFVQHIDQTSPGLPEQLLADLLAHSTENEHGQPEPLVSQMFRFYKMDFRRLKDYQNIDSLVARSTGTVTPEELAEIPSEYHLAYRSIPPSIRAAWKSYDEADQTRMLEDYKTKLEAAQRDADRVKQDEQRKAQEDAEHAQFVFDETEKYLDTVRRERTATLIQQLSQQVTYSTDPAANKVMLGSLAATMAQLLDPAWRFVVVENVLEPLGLKLDHTFDAALQKFDQSAYDSVAHRLAGATGPAEDARLESVGAANQLMAKIAVFALKVALKQGATAVEKAANQAAQLAAATVARPNIGQQPPGNGNGNAVLPAGIQPGSREAADYFARQTGLFTTSP
jgi:hypothetical protein